jgi:hypothetical protein
VGKFKELANSSYLAHYLSYFGDNCEQLVELLPFDDGELDRAHIELMAYVPSSVEIEMAQESGEFTHPCWCCAELIYHDSVRGNEVWLHKRVQ